ncbi:MAG: LPP20 family lipoprotein [Archangium sp.]|nr:LPP20 family lipoprotein [Archangium sp.]
MKKLLLAFCLAVPLGVFAQPKDAKAAEPKAQPGVNWSGQVVRATGQGAPDLKAQNPAQARLGAERAALADALRNLLAQVKGISVDGSRKMGDLMEKDEIKTRVEGIVKGFKVVNKRYFSDSGVEVEVEVPLAMLSDVIDPDTTQMLAVGKPEGEKTTTGLVIDARGLKLVPSLMPRVLDEGGKAVYSIDSLSADARKSSGVAAYVQNLDDAQKSLKAGEKPLVIKAAKATGSDLQLAPEDAKKLAALNTSFLADGKVVIVFN